MIYIEALDVVVHFVDPLLLEALAALASDDFADEIEYLKLITMMVIVSSCYYEKGVFQQSNELDPKNCLGAAPMETLEPNSLGAPFLAHPLFGSLRGPC